VEKFEYLLCHFQTFKMNVLLAMFLLLHGCHAANLSPSDCPYHGYETIVGENQGWGNVGEGKIEDVPDLGACARKCNATDNCCSFMWSPEDKNCLLYRQCDPDDPDYQYHDYKYCKSVERGRQQDCPYHGYETIVGENGGWGNVGEEEIEDVSDLGACAGKCNATDNCCSFMWSPKDENCLLYSQCNPDEPNHQFKDYKYCKSPVLENQNDCITEGGLKCKFPFTYKEKTYNDCVPSSTLGSLNWCATRTDGDGNYIEGEWGRCNAGVVCGTSKGPEEGSLAATESSLRRLIVIKRTTKYIEEEVTSGTGEEKKDKIKAYIDTNYPSLYYAIAVQGESGGFAANGDIYMTSKDGYRIVVAIATVKSTCKLSAISTGRTYPGLGANVDSSTCRRNHQIAPIYGNFDYYKKHHTVSMYAVYASGSYAYKGLRPCVGTVPCDFKTKKFDLVGHFVSTNTVHFIALNQWNCTMASNGNQIEPCHIRT